MTGPAWGTLVLLFTGLCLVGFLRGYLGRRTTTGTRPATPHAGFASPEQLRKHLSETAVRRAGEQVRPGLTPPVER